MANEEDEEYVMERIVEKRMKYGKPVYFIKWEGYPEEENTWEPREHIVSVMQYSFMFLGMISCYRCHIDLNIVVVTLYSLSEQPSVD